MSKKKKKDSGKDMLSRPFLQSDQYRDYFYCRKTKRTLYGGWFTAFSKSREIKKLSKRENYISDLLTDTMLFAV